MMNPVSCTVLVVLGLCSHFPLTKACDSALVNRVSQQPQLPDDAIDYLVEESFWTVLSNHHAQGSKVQLDFGKLSRQDVVDVAITSNGSNKSKTTYKYNAANSIKKADGSTVYLYICSDKMIGLVECKDSKSSPKLFTIAKMINPQSDVNGEINGCKQRMNAIYSSTIQNLAHP